MNAAQMYRVTEFLIAWKTLMDTPESGVSSTIAVTGTVDGAVELDAYDVAALLKAYKGCTGRGFQQ